MYLRNLFFLVVFASVSTTQIVVSQQNSNIDSLLTLVYSAKDDTNKVNLLIQISNAYSAAEYDQALASIKSCLTLSENLNYARGKQFAYVN